MKGRGFFGVLIAGILLLVVAPNNSHGFYDNAHRILSLRAINPSLPNSSTLDNFLKNTLRIEFPQGIFEPIAGRDTVATLISDGAVREDYPESRVLNHFHDPTRSWNLAGFKGIGLSSIVWSQLPFQQVGITRTWKTARDAYFNALTNTAASQRKRWYAETFRTLGHLIHHIQDAATPAHTRDDSHLTILNLDPDPFHVWADSFTGVFVINQSQPSRFNSALLNQANANSLAPIPFARISDSTDGNIGSLALAPGLNLGLAEYSNANFISKGTARSTAYQSPRLSQLDFSTVTQLPNGKRVRYAKFRPGFGEQDYRVGVSSRMALFANATVPPDSIDFGLDDNVHEDYGRKLFPRAIGYSAGLIDYFFRGKIDSTYLSPEFTWVEWGTQSNSIRVDNVNVKVDGTNETGQGTIRLVLLFRGTDSNETFPPVVVSQPVSISAGSAQTVVFPFSSLPYPATHPPVYGTYSALYSGLLVYKGSLGGETEAVVADGTCTNPNGSKFSRRYDFQHAIGITPTSGFWQESAYFEGC